MRLEHPHPLAAAQMIRFCAIFIYVLNVMYTRARLVKECRGRSLLCLLLVSVDR